MSSHSETKAAYGFSPHQRDVVYDSLDSSFVCAIPAQLKIAPEWRCDFSEMEAGSFAPLLIFRLGIHGLFPRTFRSCLSRFSATARASRRNFDSLRLAFATIRAAPTLYCGAVSAVVLFDIGILPPFRRVLFVPAEQLEASRLSLRGLSSIQQQSLLHRIRPSACTRSDRLYGNNVR